MSQDRSQLFYVDSTTVANAATVYFKSFTCYFKGKPSLENNKSGIFAPKAYLYIVDTQNLKPYIDPLKTYTPITLQYAEITTSADGSIPTIFEVADQKLALQTNKWYAAILHFDGNEDFYVWDNVKGDVFVGSSNTSSGSTAKYVGPLYALASGPAASPISANTVWNPIDGAAMKFSIDVARYSLGGILISNSSTQSTGNSLLVINGNTFQVFCPSYPAEYVTFDRKRSSTASILYGDKVYQDQKYYPGNKAIPATCGVSSLSPIVTANTNYILSNGSNFSFKNLFDIGGNPEYIVLTSLNHDGPGEHIVNVRRVVQHFSNTLGILLDEPPSFTNTNAYFFKAPVASLFSVSRNYVDGTYKDLAILMNSNANGTVRFVNNYIDSATVSNGGSGYANSDYVVVTGFESVGAEVSGGYDAIANVVTNGNGSITALYFSNSGAGFVNSSAITYSIKNANNASSSGTNANLSFVVDSVLKTESSGGTTNFKGCDIINLDFAQLLPVINVTSPPGTQYKTTFRTCYYKKKSSNTISGYAYYIDANAATLDIDATNAKTLNFHDSSNTPVLPSRSNQFSIRYANGAVANSLAIGDFYSNAAIFAFTFNSNNDYVIASLANDTVQSFYDKYNINNDYTGEEGNFGNAVSKHISTKVSLSTDQFAEDMIAYLTAYRPSTTDFKVYSRMYNSHDPDAFDDKDWTLLEQIDGIGVYSVLTNQADMKEYTYNLRAYPNSAWTDAGTVTTSLGNNVIVGSGTNFSNLVSNDLVKIYSPFFSNADYMVAVVSSVTNSSQLVLTSPVTNNSMTGSGFKIDKIAFPHQVFNDIQNDNVATYYNSNMVKFTTYDTFQMKVVLLSPDTHIVPKADDLEVVAVSA